jgi:cobalt/nickel transport protein
MDGKISIINWRYVVVKNKSFIISGFLISLFLAGVISFYASSAPDGLEKVAEDIGFIESAEEHINADGLLADYGVKGLENDRASVGLAGVVGVVATALIAGVLFRFISRKPKN